MGIVTKIVEKDEKLDAATLTLGFPDEKGQLFSLTGVGRADMDAVEEGQSYVLGFSPVVPVAPAPAPAPPVNTAPANGAAQA